MGDISSLAEPIQLNGYTKLDRLLCNTVLREIIVDKCCGWIVDFQEFSNISICLHFEITASHLLDLPKCLINADIQLSRQTEVFFRQIPLLKKIPEDISGTLQITFIHNEPDLRRHIPAVPG